MSERLPATRWIPNFDRVVQDTIDFLMPPLKVRKLTVPVSGIDKNPGAFNFIKFFSKLLVVAIAFLGDLFYLQLSFLKSFHFSFPHHFSNPGTVAFVR